MKRRAYTKRRRAEAEEATRERIVKAMVCLHEEVGPARTTVSAIAERAGVERLTVYRHFPDERSMLHACSAHWSALNPMPVLPAAGSDGMTVLRRSLTELYGWYRANAGMLERITNDAPAMPALEQLMEPMDQELSRIADALDRMWRGRSARRLATIRHALEFSTWQSLDRLTGSDERAVGVVTSWIAR